VCNIIITHQNTQHTLLLCATTAQIIKVEFTGNFGPLRPMWAHTAGLTPAGGLSTVLVIADGTSTVDLLSVQHTSVKGTKENAECSNRGLCDHATGVCSCYDTNNDLFASSDGVGGAGTRGDCGFAVTPTGGCPGEIACSGHGVCNSSTFACDCQAGWGSGDCSQRQCSRGRSWCSYPSADEVAHTAWSECSDAGLCDRDSGMCKCGKLFRGGACEYMVCPGQTAGASGAACSGHGQCMNMAELALRATVNGDAAAYSYGIDPNSAATWDASAVYGCACDAGYSGYDCSQRLCPTGDDYGSWGQVSEKQVLVCTATAGSFTLMFRQAVTAPLLYSALAADVKAALEALPTVGTVAVAYSSGAQLCTLTGTNAVSVTFLTEHSDVPALTAQRELLVSSGGGAGSGTVAIAQDGAVLLTETSVKGTTENEVCSHRGLCDKLTGTCKCFPGWFSVSDTYYSRILSVSLMLTQF
jgi:EGF-like domain